jgi:hypothetical protein
MAGLSKNQAEARKLIDKIRVLRGGLRKEHREALKRDMPEVLESIESLQDQLAGASIVCVA